jgi:hypothetical protein
MATGKKNNRFFILVLIVGLLLPVIIICRVFILQNILQPMSLFAWLFIRLFVLSTDQMIIWGLTIFAVIVVCICRLVLMPQTQVEDESPDTNVYQDNIESWRFHLSTGLEYQVNVNDLKKRMIDILISIYASRKRIEADYLVTDAFKRREIPLPDKIYTFLFTDKMKNQWWNLRRIFQKLSGREAADYYRNFSECIDFLEKFMETNDEQESFEKNHN